MKRILLIAVLLLATVLLLAACGSSVQFKLNFIVDGEVYATIDTSGNEAIKLPENPTKEGEVFDGWYWDKDTWQKPFTTNSLLNAPLSSDMNIYAKWESDGAAVKAPAFKIDGKNLFISVSNNTETFSFIDQIKVGKNGTWQISTDIYGMNAIPSKTAPLNVGDNLFYLMVTLENDVDLYTVNVRRRPIYTVSFNTANGTAVAPQQIEEDSLATKPSNPKRTGYTFEGWGYDFATPITGDTKITAAWKPIPYTITYELNGGTNAESNPKTYTIESDTITFANPMRTGYDFKGWDITTIPHGSTEKRTITASWTPTVYTITYIMNGGTNAASNPKTFTIESDTITFANPTRAGCDFAGWNISSIPHGSTENRTITANWSESNVYTITYHLDDDMNVTGNPATYTIKDGNITLAVAKKTGYTFNWYEDKNYTVKITTINTARAENLNLYAKWVANTYKITYTNTTYNGAYTAGSSIMPTVTYDSAFSLLPAQKRVGMVFLGWYYGEQQITSGIWQIPKNVTLTAKWEEDSALAPFTYISAAWTCEITGVKDKTVTALVVPDYVTSISAGAFSGCGKLRSLTIPFVGLKGFTVPDPEYPLGYIFGTSSYTGGTATTQYYYSQKADSTINTTYYIPTSLKSVTVTGGYSIYGGAFYNCSNLTSVTVGNSVTRIGNTAFYGCRGLTSITIPFVGATKDGTSNTHFGYIFSPSRDSNTNYTNQCQFIPSSLKVVITGGTSIGDYAFSGCRELKSIEIPNSVTSIGDHAFSGCSGLTSITIPNSVTSIGDHAFSGCSGLTSVTIPNSVTNIVMYAFFGCSGLTSITIPNSVTSIGEGAFYNCSGLTSITIPNSVTSIEYRAFYLCSGLTSVTIPNSVTSIGNYAFASCSGLTSIIVDEENPNYCSVDGILYNKEKTQIIHVPEAIQGNITIPNSVTSIGYERFYGCSKLESVTFEENSQLTNIGTEAFSGCSGLTSITIPNSVRKIGQSAFYGCSVLTSITIPISVTIIDYHAFYGCSELKSIYYQGTQAQWSKIEIGREWNYGLPFPEIYYAE